jgi:hypothetical protein
MYWFKRKYRQIQRVIDFLPLIWNGFDFDYQYSIDLFKKQLERTANYLESGRAHSMDAKNRASRIRTAISLMEKVYDEDYSLQYVNKLEQLYGEDVLDWVTVNVDKNEYELKPKYEKWDNREEIAEMKIKLFKEANEKQKRAHKLLWRYIEHNIQYWWD